MKTTLASCLPVSGVNIGRGELTSEDSVNWVRVRVRVRVRVGVRVPVRVPVRVRVKPLVRKRSTGEYSCRCHGKRVISAPSKPLKLKLAGHIL